MGLLSKVLFFPITGPVAGIRWSLGQVQRVVDLLDELPGPGFWAGAPMVLAGVWLATTGSRRM